ncbi:DNA mismatch repair protein Mlh3 [Heptranchias perlo]|uniref:DNA mismatch repair protein Mlh3 n=1 Tax=Heptranchias perlo TaxID=212740 RepID=UPI0035599F56
MTEESAGEQGAGRRLRELPEAGEQGAGRRLRELPEAGEQGAGRRLRELPEAGEQGAGRRLRELPEAAQAGVRSGVAVPSLARCLEELLLNSLAAGCGCAAARVGAEAGRVQVADNGAGLERAALELAGTRYYSRGGEPGEWGPGPGPGGRGEALASIAHLSGLLEIVSRPQRGSGRTWVKLFREGQAGPVYEAETGRPSPGTTVTVCNLFYRLPVRRRRLGRPLEWEQIRRRVEALSLLHPGVSFTVRDEASATAGGSLVVRLPKARGLQARFAQIYGPQKAAALGRVQHSSGGFQLNGFVSRWGHHSKARRLVFVSGRLVLKTRIHKQLDSLLRRHSLICRPGPRGAPDLQPVYIINIHCHPGQYDACWEPGRTLLEFTAWDLLLICLEEGIRAFLLREGLLVEPTEEQGPAREAESAQATVSTGLGLSHDRAAVQSMSVHRQVFAKCQAVGPEIPKWEADTEPGDAHSRGEATIRKARVSCGEDGILAVPALHLVECGLLTTEAPRHSLCPAGQEVAACGNSLLEEQRSISLRDLSTSASPEIQPVELAQPGRVSASTGGDGIYQLAAAYESERESPSQEWVQEGEEELEGGVELHGAQAGEMGACGAQAGEMGACGAQAGEMGACGAQAGEMGACGAQAGEMGACGAQAGEMGACGAQAGEMGACGAQAGEMGACGAQAGEMGACGAQAGEMGACGAQAGEMGACGAQAGEMGACGAQAGEMGACGAGEMGACGAGEMGACGAGEMGACGAGEMGACGAQAVGLPLGVTGLITHIVPGKLKDPEAGRGNSSDWGRVCRPGPVSAWDIVSERMKKGDGQLMSGDRALSNAAWERVRAFPQESVTDCQRIHGTWQYHNHSGSSAESATTSGKKNLLKDLGDSEYRNPANCEPVCCQARFHRKLSMSLITGSLDVFRRNYGKISDEQDRGFSSQHAEAIQHSTDDPATRPSVDSVTVTKGAESLYQIPGTKSASYQSESLRLGQCDCGGFLRSSCCDGTCLAVGRVAKGRASLITLPGYSQAKKPFLVAKEPLRTLAAKLSRLKDLKKGESTEEKSERSKAGSPVGQCQPRHSHKDLLQPNQNSVKCASPEPICSAGQVISENCALGAKVAGEDLQASNAGVHGTVNGGTCSDNLCCCTTDERTGNGTVTASEVDVGDRASDGNLNPPVKDSVATRKESDPVCVHTKSILAGQLPEDSVETCKDQSDALKDWLQYFDGSLGKMVYVNSVTGLSSYDVPPEAQAQAACIKDFTTMAVNVLTKTGFQYQCYPFRSHCLNPFIPRPREERQKGRAVVGVSDGRGAQLGSSHSLRSLFLEWMNPVFPRLPEVAVDVSNEQAGSLAVKIHNILYPYRFTKDMISSMQVLNQVDNKFIACLINTRVDKEAAAGRNLLVLVDQHAAHERVRLEQLISDSYEAVPGAPGQRKLCTSTVCPPMEISCTQEEARLLRLYWKHLEAAGVQVEFSDTESPGILVRKVPACFIEREAIEIRRGRQPVIQSILEEFLREQIEVLQSTGGVQGVLSRTVLKVLSSQACHGAVKFGDGLSVEECGSLMESLASCDLPFQCAHGRPSMLPLADLDHLDTDKEVHHKPDLQKLWKLCGAEGR